MKSVESSRQASTQITREINPVDLISDDVLLELARDLSLGLDENVPLMACREAVDVLFSALRRDGWSFGLPEPDTHAPRISDSLS